jgi:hypothetical protein
VAANQVFVVVTKSARTASTVSASVKLAARVVANIMPSVAEWVCFLKKCACFFLLILFVSQKETTL